jgi:hypothetical protein
MIIVIKVECILSFFLFLAFFPVCELTGPLGRTRRRIKKMIICLPAGWQVRLPQNRI